MKYIVLAILLSSCGANYHLKRMAFHEARAIEKGAKITSDTLLHIETFKFPAVNVKFEPKIVPVADRYKPIIVMRDSIQVKVVWKKGKEGGPDTLDVEAKLPAKEVKAYIPVTVNKKIEPRKVNPWPWVLIGFVMGVAVTVAITKYLSISLKRPRA